MQDKNSDQALVDRLKQQDATAMFDLARSYRSKIYQLAFRYMKSHEDAEEVTQDVLLRVHQKIGAFRGDAKLSSWIYRITFNTAMSRLRTARFSRPLEVPQADLGPRADTDAATGPRAEVADWSSLADDELYRGELRAHLGRALATLPELYRTPVVLRDIKGLSTEEASALLGVKPQTLKSRLHRGRLRLREQLAEFANGLALHRPAA